ncbi:hypothetical protein TI03_07440 [Achromatium sp. WMS1]|nr:hypothetical protein TI03_07440 [Achromatium sp. WMS1]
MNRTDQQGERLQKVLAGLGFGSRRQVETRITSGQVLLNGKIAQLGNRAISGDHIQIGKQKIHLQLKSHLTTPKLRF